MREASLPFCFRAEKETTECAHALDGKEGGIIIELWIKCHRSIIGIESDEG
jgi:hypothetical protein